MCIGYCYLKFRARENGWWVVPMKISFLLSPGYEKWCHVVSGFSKFNSIFRFFLKSIFYDRRKMAIKGEKENKTEGKEYGEINKQ